MEQKRAFQYVFYGILGSMAFYLLAHSQEIIWEDMFVAFGTVILALFTWHLALTQTDESKQTRELLIDEGKKERRRLRLKEQLEDLYSPLMAHISYFDWLQPRSNHIRGIREFMEYEIKNRYEFLATTQLRNLLITYYHPDTRTMTDQDWSIFIRNVGKTIEDDYSRIAREYYDLTKSLS